MLKKIIKVTFLGFIAVVVVAGATLAFMLRKPAPEDVCANLFDLTQAKLVQTIAGALGEDAGELNAEVGRERAAEVLGMSFDQCVAKRKAHYENTNVGLLPMAQQARCEAAAETLEEFENC